MSFSSAGKYNVLIYDNNYCCMGVTWETLSVVVQIRLLLETSTYGEWKVKILNWNLIKIHSFAKLETCSADDTFADNQKMLPFWLWPLTNSKKRLAGRGQCRYVEMRYDDISMLTSDYWVLINRQIRRTYF